MNNARQKIEDEIGFVRALGNRESVTEAVSLTQRLFQDPRAFYEQLGQELGIGTANGNGHAQQEPPTAAPEPFTIPEGDLQTEDGRQRAYSEKAMRSIIQGLRDDITRELTEQFQPALEYATEGREQQRLSEIRAESAQTIREAITAAREYPHFKENEKAIAQVLNAMDPRVKAKVGTVGAMWMAYSKVMAEQVLPSLGANAEARTIADLQRSAHAGSSTVASTSTAAPPPKIREGNITDLAKHLQQVEQRLSGGV